MAKDDEICHEFAGINTALRHEDKPDTVNHSDKSEVTLSQPFIHEGVSTKAAKTFIRP